MRILLPPSEAKASGGKGAPLGETLGAGTADSPLRSARRLVAAALDALLGSPGAAASLKLPPSVAEAALATNAGVRTSPTLPAVRRYQGVVYDGLDAVTLKGAPRRRADEEVLVFSGLFGVLRGGDPVPDYRVPAAAVLPGVGIAATFWRPVLTDVLPDLLDDGLIVDLRSTDYAAMWQPAPGTAVADQQLVVRVLSRRPDGTRKIVSYDSKLAKGRLARALLERPGRRLPARTADEVAQVWLTAGGHDAVVLRTAGRVAVLEAIL